MPIDSDRPPFIPPDSFQPEDSPSPKEGWRKAKPGDSYIPKEQHWNQERPPLSGRSARANQPINHLNPQKSKYVQDPEGNPPADRTPPTQKTRTSECNVQADSTQRSDDRRDLAEVHAGLNTEPPGLGNAICQELVWKDLRELFYPDLGSTPEEEKGIFLESLEHVTKGLDGNEKYKAVLVHIQERFKETGFTYGLDIDTEGKVQYTSTITEILQDRGQGVDCEDYAVMARFWGEAAIEKGYLPEDSEFHIIGGSSSAGVEHAVCVFEAPEGDKYIIDGILYDSDGGGNPSRLLTLAEYREDRDKLDSFLRQALLFDEAQPEAVYPDTEGPLVTEEWMNQSSDTPIDDSISDNDLKEKIYNQYDVDPDPHATKSSSYKDYLVQYGEEEFWQEKFDDFADIPDALGADIGNAMTEGTLAWGFSLYKRNKILRRRKNIIKAFEVKQKWKNLRPQKQLMTLSDFKDFGSISHLVDTKPPRDTLLKVTADIFNCHKSYRNLQDFQNLIENLTWLFPEDQELRALRTRLTPENMENPNFIVNDLEKKLKEYGISVGYEKIGTVTQKIADKFRRMQNKKLKACMYNTVINKKTLYNRLKNAHCLLEQPLLKEITHAHRCEIDTFHQLKDYDDWKLKFVRKDVIAKGTAAATGVIPFLPIDELIRARAYSVEAFHRSNNRKNMKKRVDKSLNVLIENQSSLSRENFNRIKNQLENVKELKNRHIGLKEEKTLKMTAIHTASAMVTPVTDILGPAGSAGRNAVKGTLKVANSVYPMVRRYKGDQAQKKANRFHTVQDVYKLYKELYLQALREEDNGLQDTILELANASFDLDPYEFHRLTQTSMIENNRFKLSFSRPVDKESRVYRN